MVCVFWSLHGTALACLNVMGSVSADNLPKFCCQIPRENNVLVAIEGKNYGSAMTLITTPTILPWAVWFCLSEMIKSPAGKAYSRSELCAEVSSLLDIIPQDHRCQIIMSVLILCAPLDHSTQEIASAASVVEQN